MKHATDLEKASTTQNLPSQDEGILVTFDTPIDSENPKDWKSSKKWAVTGVLSATGLTRIVVSTIMAPALPSIADELQMNSVEAAMALSVYLLATAFGPLFIAPLSESYGRKPVLHATNVWFLAWNIVCGFAGNKATLIAARLLAGFGASAIYALSGGVLGDVWPPEQRGKSIGIYLLIPLLGAAIGPILGGFITEYTTWRWMFWSTSIVQFMMVAVSMLLFHETHAPTILRGRAHRFRQQTGNPRYYTEVERMTSSHSIYKKFFDSLTRPMRLLIFHPIVQIQALLSGFSYGVLYLILSTFSELWVTQYGESTSISGLHYLSICLGELAGAVIGGRFIDVMYRRLKNRADGAHTPEFRMPVMIPGAILVPLGLFMYGWTAQEHVHWIVVDIGVFVLSFGLQIRGAALQAYVIDCYPDHTSSASAASQFLRSLAAFGFPLFAPKMYKSLGYGWANSTIAFIAIAIGIPAPFLIQIYGARLRAKAQSSY